MAETYTLEAVLSARDAGFTAGLKQASGQASSFGDSIKKSFVFGAVVRAGQTAFTSITSGIKGMVSELSASSATWQTFEGNMRNFGKSSKEIGKVKSELQDFATKTIYSSSDMASTYSQMAAVGVKDTANLVKAFGGLAAAAENPQQAMKTLSQQGTQMAAKPTVAWQDFKLMLEQTPAGVAAVAKAMGTTTQGLIKNVQAGTVKTEDFFNAMKKAAGQGTKFEKMATTYKTVGQAMDGLKESLTNKLQPAFDVLNKYGIKAVESISGIVDKIDGDKIAATLSNGLEKAVPLIKEAVSTIGPIALQVGSNLMTFGKAVGSFLSDNKAAISQIAPVILTAIAGFKTFGKVSSLVGAISSKSGTTMKNSWQKAFQGLGTMFKGLGQGINTALKGLVPIIKTSFQGITSIFKTLPPIVKSIANGVATIFKTLPAIITSVAQGIGTALQGIVKAFNMMKPQGLLMFAGAVAVVVAALVVLGMLHEPVLAFINGFISAIGNLTNILNTFISGVLQGIVSTITQLADVFSGILTVAINAVVDGLVKLAPVMGIISQALVQLSPFLMAAAQAFSVVFSALSEGLATILPALEPVIEAVGTAMASIITAITEGLAKILPVLEPIVSAIGSAVSQIITAFTPIAQIIGDTIVKCIQAIAPFMPNIERMVAAVAKAIQSICSAFKTLVVNLSSIIATIGGVINTLVSTVASAVVNIINSIANGISTIISSIAGGISQVVESITGGIANIVDSISGVIDSINEVLKTFGDNIKKTFDGASNVIRSFGDAVRNILDGIAGIFDSIGNAALNAGKGFKELAQGVKLLVDLKLGDLAATLATVSGTIATMAGSGGGLKKAGEGMSNLATNGDKAASGMVKVGSVAEKLGTALSSLANKGKESLTTLQNAMKDLQKTAKTAGEQAGNGFSTSLNKGLKKGVQYAKTNGQNMNKTFSSTIRSGRSAVQQAGAYLAQGLVAGLRSRMGEIRAVAQEIISTVDSAMRAAGQIHSPSKLTEEIGIYLARGVVYGLRRGGYEVIKMSGNIMEKSMTKMEQIIANAKVVKAAQHAFNDVHKTVKVSLMDMVGEMRNAVDAVKGGYGISGDNFIDAFTEKVTESLEDSSRLAKASIQDAFNRYYQLAELQNDIDANKSLIERNEKTISIRKDANEALEDKIKENKKLVKANAKTVEQQRKNNVALRNITKYQNQIDANKKFINSLELANSRIENQNKNLEKKLTANKELASSQFDTFYNKFSKYLTKAADKAKATTQNAIKEITSQYQSLYDSIISKQENYAGKLSDIGELYTVDTYGATSFANLQRMTEQAKAYASNITKLKKLLPDGFMESILGNMSREQGLAYTNALLKKSEAELKEYGAQYTEFMETSEHLAQRNYIGQLTSVEAKFHNAVLDTYKGLEAELQNLGSDSLAGFIKGMNDGTGALQSAAEKMGLTLTGTLRNVLQIGSPSKVLRKMGQFAGEGFVEGLLAMASQIKTATAEVFGIDDSSMRLAYAGVDLPEGAQYSPIVRQETTVITTLDGREVARTIVDPMSDELNRKNRRDGRKNGKL